MAVEVLVQYPLMKWDFLCVYIVLEHLDSSHAWNKTVYTTAMPNCHAEGGDLTPAHKITEGAFSGMDPVLLAEASGEPGRAASLRELSASRRVTGLSGCSPQSCCCQDDGPSASSQPMMLPATVTIACYGLPSRFPDAFFLFFLFFFPYLFIYCITIIIKPFSMLHFCAPELCQVHVLLVQL